MRKLGLLKESALYQFSKLKINYIDGTLLKYHQEYFFLHKHCFTLIACVPECVPCKWKYNPKSKFEKMYILSKLRVSKNILVRLVQALQEKDFTKVMLNFLIS